MAFVELDNGNFINVNLIEAIKFSLMQTKYDPNWIAYFDEGMQRITDADCNRILKAAGFVKIKKEKDDE